MKNLEFYEDKIDTEIHLFLLGLLFATSLFGMSALLFRLSQENDVNLLPIIMYKVTFALGIVVIISLLIIILSHIRTTYAFKKFKKIGFNKKLKGKK